MSNYRKKPKKRKFYRFEGRKLTDLPKDIDWLALVEHKKVKTEWLLKWAYWFDKGTKKELRESRNVEEEARARRTHQTFTFVYNINKLSWWKKLLNLLNPRKWQLSLQKH